MACYSPLDVIWGDKEEEEVADRDDEEEDSHLLRAKAEQANQCPHHKGEEISDNQGGAVRMQHITKYDGQRITAEHQHHIPDLGRGEGGEREGRGRVHSI